jgi:hypothetical protein
VPVRASSLPRGTAQKRLLVAHCSAGVPRCAFSSVWMPSPAGQYAVCSGAIGLSPTTPRSEAELLHVLTLPDLDGAGAIQSYWGNPKTRTCGELLIARSGLGADEAPRPYASTCRELRRNANGAAREVVRRGRRRAVGSASPRSSTIWQGARARGVERAPPAGVPTGRPRARRRVARRSCTTWRSRRSDQAAAHRVPRDLSAPATTEAGRPSEGAALRRRGSRDREALAHPR